MKDVYVVSYLADGDIEPIITVFDNKEAAQKMHNHLKDQGVSHVWLDHCSLYHKYSVFKEGE